MIRDYPKRKERYEYMHAPVVTAKYGEHISGAGATRATETVALRQLPPIEQREYEAVRRAVLETERAPGGDLRMKLIKLVYWDKTHRLYGAAIECRIEEATSKRWNGDFIRVVARNFGLLDKDDTPEPKTCDKIVS